MALKVFPQALVDIRTADAWWRANRPAARQMFRDELRQAFRLLPEHPRLGAAARGTKAKGIRRIFLRRTRYFIYYSVQGPDIEVLRVWHASRQMGPGL